MHYGFTRSTPNLDSPALRQTMASQWDWANGAAADEEMNYASQLRSSMATLLNAHSHMRQASTTSTSSNFSSYSAEDTFTASFHDPNQNITPTRKFSADNSTNSNIHSGVGAGMCSALSGSSYEAFHQDLDLYCKQYGGWMDADSIGIPPPPPPASLSPPPPPVRDSSSLKYIKYGPGHEKHPSWPMPGAAASCAQSQSQRSKSWTEQTDYPKDPAPAYVRPHSKRLNPVYSQQLKTVLENCERIPHETFQPKSLDSFSPANYLPTYDCDGHAIDDKDYNIPSPPERDVGNLASDTDYAKYEDIQQYSHSEGYSSYVPSESSYVSVTGTPLLDQLRRDSDAQVINVKEKEVKDTGAHTGRDSVTTVVTNSSSNSSNETLRWHGSYSDISVMSGSSSRLDSNAIVVHSAKVQAPQRHHSESILYYAPEHPKSRPSWNSREKNQHWNKKPAKRAESVTSSTNEELFSVVDTSQPPSVQERIHQLERQSKSVPNLAERWRAADKNQQQQQQRSRHNLSLANGGQSINVDKDDSTKVNYTFLDPEKRLKVADPTLKAIQRQALMSYYERYTKGSSSLDHGSPTSPKEATASPLRSSPDSSSIAKNETTATSRASVPNSSSSIPAHTASEPCAPVKLEAAQQAELVPPERPPKKPHLRPRQPPIIPDNELRRIEASAKELINLNHSRTSPRRKPPAPDPPPTPPPPPGPPPAPQAPPPALQATPSPLVSVSTATNPLVPELSKPLVRKSSSQSWENPVPAPSEAPVRIPSPDLPPPPPPSPPPSSVSEVCAPDEPLPPPPSPLAAESTNQEAAVPDRASPKSPTYHKESYMVHRKNVGLLHRHSADNLLSVPDRSLSPTSWDQQHNIRKGDSSAALVLSAEDLRTESQPKSFISQVTFQTELSVPLPVVEPQQPLIHTYRAVAQPNAERFAYLRKISSGDWSRGPKETHPDSQDPPPKSPGIVGIETPVKLREVEKNIEEQPPVIRNVTQPKISTLPRPKRPEELECDQLSKDLISHLSPSDKLHALLRVPGPDHPTTTRIVEGLFEQPEATSVKKPSTTPTTTPTTSPSKVDSCTQLPLNSAYFTTSEPKAKLLARYGSDIISEQSKEPVNSDVLLKKKEDLMIRLGKKLEVLRSERLLVQEEVESNEELGRLVQSKVTAVATTPESNKVALHVAEVDKITSLLLALAGRLARAQNALVSLPADADPQEKAVLEGKRDKLVEQLEEAKRLKENIDRRSVQVAALLSKYLGEEEFADYTHFVTMKAKLVMDAKEIDEKIKLGEEQLAALRETLHVRPRV